MQKNKEKFASTKSDKADKVLTHKIWGIPIFLVVLFAIFHLTFSEDLLYLGKMLGGLSAMKIGQTANKFGLKTEEYGITVLDKSPYSSKQVASFRYNQKGVEKLAELLGLSDKVKSA